MLTRRMTMMALPYAVFAGSVALAASPAEDDLPKPALVPGKPPLLDYGGGVKVPCNKRAFLTLWEGESFWLTFGFGISSQPIRAKGEAAHRALGAMKYLLLTLAFAPERLEKVEGNGWHQIVEAPENYVLGEIDIPGRSGMPMTDAFRGFGNAEQAGLGGVSGTGGIGPGSPDMQGAGGNGFNPAMMLTKVHAFCTYFVKKSDLGLEDVRQRAKMVQL